jgi:tRNA A-37 threonylcarbamoyl transferase component Bud32
VDRGARRLLVEWSGLDDLVQHLEAAAGWLGYRALWIPTLLVLVYFGRWRHFLVYLGTISLIAAMAQVAVGQATLARAVRVTLTGSADQVVVPAWPVVVLAAVVIGSLFALAPPGRVRRWGWVVALVMIVSVAAARVALGLDSASATVASGALGVGAAALAFLVLAPAAKFPVRYHREVKAHLRIDARRRNRICKAVRDQLGIELTGLEPYRLGGSAGSTPCKLTLAGGPALFGKLYAVTHLRSDRWYKYGRVLLYGRLEDEAPFSSVRRLVEHEDYMLRLLRDGGVRVPEPVGVVEVVPGREYLLVTELVPDACEILEKHLDDELLDDALRQVRALWSVGVAHRDVKPSNLLVQGSRVFLVDVAFGELRPSRWRQAVDLANMMLTLALGAGPAGPERVVARAVAYFGRDELAEAFASTGSVTVPRQLHRLIDSRRPDLVSEFRSMLPNLPPIAVQRWSTRRVLLALAAVGGVLAAVILTGINLRAGRLL